MADIEEINKDSFSKILDSDIPVLVDFYAQWCGPCRKLTPILEQIQGEYKDLIKIYKINSDENTEILKEYGVMGLPTLILFQQGEVKETMTGMMPKSAIVSNVKKLLS